jgi:RND family efflux transporter MFP subunit
VQPGSVEPFESADLYAKVSGYLSSQTLERVEVQGGKPVFKPVLKDGKPVRVDIGTPVQAGDVLARISVPESEKQVQQDAADVARAESKVEQVGAAITTAEADLGASAAGVALAQAELKSKTSYRAFREKQRDRIKELVNSNSLERKKLEEEEDQAQAAISAELAATEAINAARQKQAAAKARVEQAKADLKYAQSEVAVAKARLEKSQTLLDYAVIRSPYTGVVTKRTYHPGDFVRSAEAGGERVPLLTVERTDVMRVVVQVPERDVPFVDIGDPATVVVDALGETVTFKTTGTSRVEISRTAAAEDPHTRMMRIEVDLTNPDGKLLRRGMYGRATLLLQVGSPTAVRVPSSALVGKAEGGNASVRVVRDDVVHVVPVKYGADNGSDVEIVSGLTPADRVVVRASGPVDNGTQVSVTSATGKSAH